MALLQDGGVSLVDDAGETEWVHCYPLAVATVAQTAVPLAEHLARIAASVPFAATVPGTLADTVPPSLL